MWYNTKNFPKGCPRPRRGGCRGKEQLIEGSYDVPMEIQKEDAMELEKVKEGMVHSLKKTKFGRKATEDMESMSNVDEVMDSEASMIGEIPISLNCSTVSLILPTIFK